VALSSLSDNELLQKIQQGSHPAFAELATRYAATFYRLCYRYLGQHEEAEELVQVTFLQLWEKPYQWDETRNTKFTTWFYKILVNKCLDRLKKHSHLHLHDEALVEDKAENQEASIILKQKQQILENAIRSLPKRQQTALNLCFYEEMSNKEAATIMGISVKALESLLIRAKNSLKQQLAGQTHE